MLTTCTFEGYTKAYVRCRDRKFVFDKSISIIYSESSIARPSHTNMYMHAYIPPQCILTCALYMHYSHTLQITATLESSPLQFLRPSEKVQILSHLVGQLLDSASLTREVDTRMEQLASLRRDKWKISLKMKR